MRVRILPKIIFAVALSAGCAGTVGYSASTSSDGYGPDLVYAAPGVQVIADYDEPIFYADNFYWRFDSGTWYRSTSYTGGWGYAPAPAAIVRIDRPDGYVHFRPHGWTPRRIDNAPRDHREPAARAMRTPPPERVAPPPPQRVAPPPPQRVAPPPPDNTRDHRQPDNRGAQPDNRGAQPDNRGGQPDNRGGHGQPYNRGDHGGSKDHRDPGK